MKKIIVLLVCILFLSGCATSLKTTQLEPIPFIPYEKTEPKITYVFKNSGAEKAGFKSGDLILEVDGYKIKNNAWAYGKLKELAEASKEGIVKIKRGDEVVDIKFKPNIEESGEQKHTFGLLFLPEEYTLVLNPKLSVNSQTRDGISIGVSGMVAENNPLGGIILFIQNYTEKDVAIYPNDILVLDGNNTLLKIFGGQIIAASAQEKAERDYVGARSGYTSAMSYAQSLPPTYTVTGGTTQLGTLNGNMQGTLYSYGNYGQYSGTHTSTYSGSSYSNYAITPQPNIMASATMLGSAIGLAMAQSQYQQRQKLAQEAFMNAFEFGLIPAGVNRKGTLYFETPLRYPLQIKIKLNNNEYLFKLDKPKENTDNKK